MRNMRRGAQKRDVKEAKTFAGGSQERWSGSGSGGGRAHFDVHCTIAQPLDTA